MIQLFKKANDKAGAEVDPKDPTKQKWNADAVFVKIDNEMVPLSELAKHAKENEYEPVQSVENELEINGTICNVSDLITKYQEKKKNVVAGAKDNPDEAEKAAAAAKKNAEEEEKKKKEEENKKNEVAGAKDNPDEAEAKAKKEQAKKNEEDEVKKKLDDEEKIKKQSKEDEEEEEKKKKENARDNGKDVRHFIRLNTARENGSTTNILTIDTMHNRIDRGKDRYGSAAA